MCEHKSVIDSFSSDSSREPETRRTRSSSGAPAGGAGGRDMVRFMAGFNSRWTTKRKFYPTPVPLSLLLSFPCLVGAGRRTSHTPGRGYWLAVFHIYQVTSFSVSKLGAGINQNW